VRPTGAITELQLMHRCEENRKQPRDVLDLTQNNTPINYKPRVPPVNDEILCSLCILFARPPTDQEIKLLQFQYLNCLNAFNSKYLIHVTREPVCSTKSAELCSLSSLLPVIVKIVRSYSGVLYIVRHVTSCGSYIPVTKLHYLLVHFRKALQNPF
jgi:hypothetical protein